MSDAATSLRPAYRAVKQRMGEWSVYAGDKASSKYSPLTQINAANVRNLQVVWRWSSADNAVMKKRSDLHPGPNESTPLMVGGILYTSTSLNQVAAIDARTGAPIWLYNPKSYGGVHRGLAWSESGSERRIFLSTSDSYL